MISSRPTLPRRSGIPLQNPPTQASHPAGTRRSIHIPVPLSLPLPILDALDAASRISPAFATLTKNTRGGVYLVPPKNLFSSFSRLFTRHSSPATKPFRIRPPQKPPPHPFKNVHSKKKPLKPFKKKH